jgi:FG-GAP repeat protein
MALAGALLVAGAGAARAAGLGVWADFNGDGYRDVVAAAPDATVDGHNQAGLVSVLYGGPHGLEPVDHPWFRQGYGGVPGAPVTDGHFGRGVGIGDLDRDGYADLVIGAAADATALAPVPLTVVWGGPGGLGRRMSTLPYPGAVTGRGVLFGASLKVADFNGDGVMDLAAEAADLSYDTPGSIVVFTSVHRTSTARHYTVPGVGSFGVFVCAGDVTGDHISDVVGLTDLYNFDADIPTLRTVLYRGTRSGLVLAGKALPGGTSCAVGDIDHDGIGDVVIGHPDDSGAYPGGRITVVYGAKNGPGTGRRTQVFAQGTPGVPGVPEYGDWFGASVAVGDINGDGFKDVAIGVPSEAIGTTRYAGAVTVLYGSRSGLTTTHAQTRTQYDGVNATGLGHSVAVGDTNRDRRAELLAAAPGNAPSGTVWDFPGTRNGLSSTAPRPFTPYNTGWPSHLNGYASLTD